MGTHTVTNINGEGQQVYLAKYDAEGSVLWLIDFPAIDAYSNIHGVATDGDGNAIVVGGFDHSITLGAFTLTNTLPNNISIYLAKISPAGEVIWAHGLGNTSAVSAYSVANSVTTDALGNIYITGDFQNNPFIIDDSITLPETGVNHFFAIKFNPDGIAQWAKPSLTGAEFGSAFAQSAIAVGADGSVYMTGPFMNWISFDGMGVSILGDGMSTFLVKFDANGQTQFIKKYGTTGSVSPKDIEIDADGNVYLLGAFSSSLTLGSTNLATSGYSDIFLAKLEADGDVAWGKKAGGIYNDFGNSLAISADALYVTGEFNSPSMSIGSLTLLNPYGTAPINNPNGFIAKYQLNGTLDAAIAPQNTAGTSFTEVSTQNNYIYAVGYYTDHFTVGDISFFTDTYKMFASRINPETLGLWDVPEAHFLIYPNPATNILYIQSSGNIDVEYIISNLMGQQIKSGTAYDQQLDVSNLSSGMYILSVEGTSAKFIKN